MLDEPHLLEMMLEDMDMQKGIYQPGPFWKEYTKRVAAAIQTNGLENYGKIAITAQMRFIHHNVKRTIHGLELIFA